MNRSLLLLAFVLASSACANSVQALEAVCLPDRDTIASDGSAIVRAFSDAPADAGVLVTWKASRGQVEPTSDVAVVRWRPGGGEEAPPIITARVTAGTESAMCSAQVAVVPSPERGAEGNIVATRLLLPATVPEPPGYGLYSYVLIAHRPQTDEERERVESVLKAFLSLSGAEAMEKAGAPRSKLNATIVSISQALPNDFDQRDDKTAWVRNHYAFEQALKLLLKLHNVAGDAAFSTNSTVWIVSCLHPLATAKDPRPVLVQDLSAVPPRLIGLWASRFSAVTTQPRLYDQYSVAKLSLDLRIVIAHAGDGLEAVRAAFTLLGSKVLD